MNQDYENAPSMPVGTREHFYPSYEFLTPELFERMAVVMTEGAKKYGVGNWQNFTHDMVKDIQRHAFDHMMKYMNGFTDEDHLAHAACNLMMLAWYENARRQRTPDDNVGFRRELSEGRQKFLDSQTVPTNLTGINPQESKEAVRIHGLLDAFVNRKINISQMMAELGY